MGIPYSKQINAAFDQVTPLVASAYEVLETTKNIAIFITAIQIGIITLLFINLLALLALLFTLHPELEDVRDKLVTPALRWTADWIVYGLEKRYIILGISLVISAVVGAAGALYVFWVTNVADATSGEDQIEAEKDEESVGGLEQIQEL